MNYSSVYWIHEGMPYVDESKLKKCGCGGSLIVDFLFDYETKQFIDASITCKECGMTTQFKGDINEVIRIWNKAFSEDYLEYYDVCTGCSSNFGKDEYY